MQVTLKCNSRPGKAKDIAPKDSAAPVLPLPYAAVSEAFRAISGQKLCANYCREIADAALEKMFRSMRRMYPTMVEDMDLHWRQTERAKRRRATNKRADTDVVGGGGTDAPGTED